MKQQIVLFSILLSTIGLAQQQSSNRIVIPAASTDNLPTQKIGPDDRRPLPRGRLVRDRRPRDPGFALAARRGRNTVLLTRRIPVKSLIDEADPELNIRLEGGEEIRVPEAGRVYIVGNVKRPGAFPIKDSAETSGLKVLALTEGGKTGKSEIPIQR
jgi:hypothetical protein